MRLVVLAGISVVAACTHTQTLGDGRALAGASVRFQAQPAYEEDGDVVETQDGLLIRADRGDFKLDEVLEITEIKRGRGALEGSGWGSLVGGVGGAALGYASGGSDGYYALSATGTAVVSGIVLGAFGSLVGLVIGFVRGSRDVYTIRTPPSQTRLMPAGQASSAVGATVRF